MVQPFLMNTGIRRCRRSLLESVSVSKSDGGIERMCQVGIDMASVVWDYVVIGAGSAGCALTEQLVRAGKSVLLLEAGGRDRSPYIKVPAGQLRAIACHDWGYLAEADLTRNGIVESWARGRVLGGSSSVNGTIYTRGVPSDYDGWGLPGWSWEEVLPIFQEFEGSDQPGPLRGQSGSLSIRTVRHPHAVTRAFVRAAQSLNLPFNADYNGRSQEGVGFAQLSQRRGFRCSAADAFLRAVSRHRNLSVLLNALVTRIEFANRRAVAVHFEEDGKSGRAAARGVVLCAGAINSPQVLMLSGIGDAQELRRKQIELVLDRPAVGRNLQDQSLISPLYRTTVPTYNLTEGLWQKMGYAAKFLLYGEGPLSNLFEAAAFLRSSASLRLPDLQVIFSAIGYRKNGDGRYVIEDVPSVMVHVMLSYPESRGRISLRSSNPSDPPSIECPLLEASADAKKLIAGFRMVRRIMEAAPMAPLILAEALPGKDAESDATLEDYVRRHAGIAFHPIGTCRMGLGPDAVVGLDLRVQGIENLWIADASVIPKHPSANTNAVCIMVGRKLGRELAAKSREA